MFGRLPSVCSEWLVFVTEINLVLLLFLIGYVFAVIAHRPHFHKLKQLLLITLQQTQLVVTTTITDVCSVLLSFIIVRINNI